MELTYEDLRDRRCLIIHGDDLGMCHSINQANFEALSAELITSASVMAPCPRVDEVSEFFQKHSDGDIGFHLTLTSEFAKYRWQPMSGSAKEAGLTDEGGFMHQRVTGLLRAARTIEHEIRAQRLALESFGLSLTHMDCHMYAAFKSPILLRDYILSAAATSTIALVPSSIRPVAFGCAQDMHHLIPKINIIGVKPTVPAESWLDFYRSRIETMPIGLNILLVHLGYDTPELRAIQEGSVGWDAQWRQRDFDVIINPRFRDSLLHNDVILLNWKRVAEILCR